MHATQFGHKRALVELLNVDADVTKQDVRGRTAMAFAAATDNQEIMKLLADSGAGE